MTLRATKTYDSSGPKVYLFTKQHRGLGTYVSLEKWCRTTYIVTSSKHCQNIMLDMEIEVMGVVLKNKWWKIKKNILLFLFLQI